MNVIHAGNTMTLTAGSAIFNELPSGIYDVGFDGRTNEFTLHTRPPFKMPPKIYGGCNTFASRCLKTFQAMEKGMGVLLSGPKGCGKTLTAKQIAMQSNLPVLCVSSPYSGPEFTEFLTEVPARCVIFIDEFEKVYRREEDRNPMLALMDGASDNRHLFILTSNSHDIGEFFSNRPGRIRYHRKYENLPKETLLEMVADRMPAGPLHDKVAELVDRIGFINPDALSTIIDECLIHGDEPEAFMDFFNVSTELTGPWDVTIRTQGFRPKLNLEPDQLNEARAYILAIATDGEHYAECYHGEGKKFCETKPETWNNPYAFCFDRGSNDEGFMAEVYNATMGEGTKTRRFNLMPHEIKTLRHDRGCILVETKKGDHWTFRRASKRVYGSAAAV